MPNESIRVFLRVRPPDNPDSDLESKCVEVDSVRNVIRMDCKPEPKIFTYDQVADVDITQEFVFRSVGKEIIESALKGYNGTIFAYGQTGSGKTFTMLGPQVDNAIQHEWRGVIPRTFGYIFSLIDHEQQLHGENVQFLLRCSFLEIYNEQIFDLLEPTSHGLHMRENMKHGVYVEGLTERTVNNSMESYEVLMKGMQNRRVAATSMNHESSRSHAVFTIHLESKEKREGVQNVKMSRLHLVDLAGSERQKDTNAAGQRLKEAGSINKSLSVLGHVIMSLVDIAQGKDRYVPYRDSKLSFLLRDSLGGNAMTCIIACVNPSSRCFGETLSTLQFARRAKMIKNKAVINEDSQGNVTHLQTEIRRLKEHISQLHASMANGAPGGPPSAPTPPIHIPMPSSVDQEELDNWKRRFIEAMYFRDKTEQEKQLLKSKICQMEVVIQKKDKFLQNQKMIVKFKESRIAAFEKQMKDAGTENELMKSYSDEIITLKENMLHNPRLTQCSLENGNLRNEIKRLHAAESVTSGLKIENEKIEQLEKVFAQLTEEEGAGDNGNVEDHAAHLCTPDTNDNVANATKKRHEEQVLNFKSEINRLKEELQKTHESEEKQRLNLQSELASFKKSNEELQKVLEAYQLQSRMELDSLQDMHLNTIRTFTTPTKMSNTMRNREIHKRSIGEPIDLIIEEEEEEVVKEDIFSETELPQMAEQAKEALTDEIKKLQDSNRSLQETLEARDSENMKLKQSNSKSDSLIEQLNHILESERSSYKKTNDSLEKQVASLTKSLKSTESHEAVLAEEVAEWKLLLGSSDSELKTCKLAIKDQRTALDSELAGLETDLSKVTHELLLSRRDLDNITKEKEVLQEEKDTATDTISYMTDEMDELEKKLLQERKTVANLQNDLQNTDDKLHSINEKYTQLVDQIKHHGKKEKELAESVEDNRELRNCIYKFQEQIETSTADFNQLEVVHKKLKVENANLNSIYAENKEYVSHLVNKSREQNSEISQLNKEIIDLKDEVCSFNNKIDDLQKFNEQQKMDKKFQEKKLQQLTAESQQLIAERDMEVCIYKDEFEDLSEQYKTLQRSSATNNSLHVAAQDELKKSKEEIDALNKQLQIKTAETDEFKRNLQMRNLETAKNESTKQELHTILQQRIEEFTNYKIHQSDIMKKQLDEFDKLRNEKNCEIETLKAQLMNFSDTRGILEKLQGDYQVLERDYNYSMLREKELTESIKDNLVKTDRLQSKLMEDSVVMTDHMKEKEILDNRLSEANLKIVTLHEEMDNKDETITRLSNSIIADQNEKATLQSKLEEIREKKASLIKENEVLKTDNAKLSGHQNLHQKIHHVQTLKHEKEKLIEEVTRLRSELERHVPKKHITSTLKENFNPK